MLAGRVGIASPWNLTLRELAWMVEGRDRDEQAKLAGLKTIIAASHGAKRARPSDFDPYGRAPAAGTGGASIRYVFNGMEVSKRMFGKLHERYERKH